MSEVAILVSIPKELSDFYKTFPNSDTSKINFDINFGVKLHKKLDGTLHHISYYSDSGDLIKEVFYDGFAIESIRYFNKQGLHKFEIYKNDQIVQKHFYDVNKNKTATIDFEYNRLGKVFAIRKSQNKALYEVEYGYDELNRVNSRKIMINGALVNEQRYRFDILDRIIEYSDFNQRIKIQQITPENELIYYTITDKMDNEICIINHFDLAGKYLNTDITLNGHTHKLKDKGYVENVMLKKPYTTEDDLDLIISNLYKTENVSPTKRTTSDDCATSFIDENITARVLPISIRKRVLYNMSLNVY